MANDETPKSLLSFLYHVMYDEQVRQDFHEDEIEAMERFGVPERAQKLLREIGKKETGSPDGALQKWKELLEKHLSKELHDSRDIIW